MNHPLYQSFVGKLRPGQLVEALIDSVPGLYYFIKDRESRFVGANLRFAKTLGEPSVDRIIGKTDFDYSADFLAEAFQADDRVVMTTGVAVINKVELVPNRNALDWVVTSKIPLWGKDGTVVGMAGLTRSIQESESIYHDHPEMRYIAEHVKQGFRHRITIADMASVAGISPSSVDRLFRKTFGITPFMYLRKIRLNAACALLRGGVMNLVDIAVQCGFNDQASMTRAFRMELKITPLRYRNRFRNDKKPQVT